MLQAKLVHAGRSPSGSVAFMDRGHRFLQFNVDSLYLCDVFCFLDP